MFKHELRKLYLQKRKELSVQEARLLNDRIKFHFDQYLPADVQTVHIFLPIQGKSEIDTWPIIHNLWERNIRVVAPVMEPKEVSISSWLLTEHSVVKENNSKVPEPEKKIPVDDSLIDVVVVPLLAFDKKGFRVGYGKGYYDRFMASLDHKVERVGLSFFPPIEAVEGIETWDVPLDCCITPEGLTRF